MSTQSESQVTAGWDLEMLERCLTRPEPRWGRDLTYQGVEMSIHSDAGMRAWDVTGQDVGTGEHTAVWLVLALAGRRRVGTAGSGISLGDYLGTWTGRGRDHYRRIVDYSPGSEPDRTVRMVAAVLGASPANRPDPLLLAADLAELLSEDVEIRHGVAVRWARSLVKPVVD